MISYLIYGWVAMQLKVELQNAVSVCEVEISSMRVPYISLHYTGINEHIKSLIQSVGNSELPRGLR